MYLVFVLLLILFIYLISLYVNFQIFLIVYEFGYVLGMIYLMLCDDWDQYIMLWVENINNGFDWNFLSILD